MKTILSREPVSNLIENISLLTLALPPHPANLDKAGLKRLIIAFQKDLKSEQGTIYASESVTIAKFENIIVHARKFIPEHNTFLSSASERITDELDSESEVAVSEFESTLDYILELLDLQENAETRIEEGRVFSSAEEKMREAGKSFASGDYSSVLNNLNTALELALKDRLEIPTTITSINTTRIIEILVAERIGPVEYMTEVKKHLLQLDNKNKHQGYNPSKLDCVNAIKALEDLVQRLRTQPLELPKAVRSKIYADV
jgi:hypothetical protein